MKNNNMKKRVGALFFALFLALLSLFGRAGVPSDNVANIVILPDTQLYAKYYNDIFQSQIDYIIENNKEKEVDFVMQLGDVINNSFEKKQWDVAIDLFDKLDQEKIPYSVAVGNHELDYKRASIDMLDYYDDIRIDENEPFLKYFPAKRYKRMSTYGGQINNGYSQYHFVKLKDTKILVIALDWLPGEETLEQTKRLLEKHKDLPTIIFKHDFIKPSGKSDNNFPNFSSKDNEEQWEIFSHYEQIFMIINGHFSGYEHGVVKNKNGDDVLLMVVDYQGESKGGYGYLRDMIIDFENNFIDIKTSSPYIKGLSPDLVEENYPPELLDDKHTFKINFMLNERFIN